MISPNYTSFPVIAANVALMMHGLSLFNRNCWAFDSAERDFVDVVIDDYTTLRALAEEAYDYWPMLVARDVRIQGVDMIEWVVACKAPSPSMGRGAWGWAWAWGG